MQAIKLVYIAHGWHLGLADAPLISEPIRAWKYGPVIESLYHAYKIFGRGYLQGELPVSTAQVQDIPRLAPFLDSVWGAYSKFSGGQLSTLTHQKDTPWYKVWNEHGGSDYLNQPIPDHLIKDHYKSKANAGAK